MFKEDMYVTHVDGRTAKLLERCRTSYGKPYWIVLCYGNFPKYETMWTEENMVNTNTNAGAKGPLSKEW